MRALLMLLMPLKNDAIARIFGCAVWRRPRRPAGGRDRAATRTTKLEQAPFWKIHCFFCARVKNKDQFNDCELCQGFFIFLFMSAGCRHFRYAGMGCVKRPACLLRQAGMMVRAEFRELPGMAEGLSGWQPT